MVGSIEDAISCPVCKEILLVPKALPCGHSICGNCVSRIYNGISMRCPICRRGFQFELGGSLPTNLALRDVVLLLASPDNERLTCASRKCWWTPAAFALDSLWLCGQCDQLFCSSCVVKAHRDHRGVETYQEFRSCAVELIIAALRPILPLRTEFDERRAELFPAIQLVDRSIMHCDESELPSAEEFDVCKLAKGLISDLEKRLSSLIETNYDIAMRGKSEETQTDSKLLERCAPTSAALITPAVMKAQLSLIEELANLLPNRLSDLAGYAETINKCAEIQKDLLEKRQEKLKELETSRKSSYPHFGTPEHPIQSLNSAKPNSSPRDEGNSCQKAQSSPSLDELKDGLESSVCRIRQRRNRHCSTDCAISDGLSNQNNPDCSNEGVGKVCINCDNNNSKSTLIRKTSLGSPPFHYQSGLPLSPLYVVAESDQVSPSNHGLIGDDSNSRTSSCFDASSKRKGSHALVQSSPPPVVGRPNYSPYSPNYDRRRNSDYVANAWNARRVSENEISNTVSGSSGDRTAAKGRSVDDLNIETPTSSSERGASLSSVMRNQRYRTNTWASRAIEPPQNPCFRNNSSECAPSNSSGSDSEVNHSQTKTEDDDDDDDEEEEENDGDHGKLVIGDHGDDYPNHLTFLTISSARRNKLRY